MKNDDDFTRAIYHSMLKILRTKGTSLTKQRDSGR